MADVKRITDELQTYWTSLKQDKPYPSENQINPDMIAEIWDHCFLVKHKDGKFAFELMGSSILEAYSSDEVSNTIIADQLYPEKPGITKKFLEVVESKKPVYYEGEFVNADDIEIKFRKILLPIGKDGQITHLLGGMRWRVASALNL